MRTARSKGAGERTVLVRHVLRNSLIPIATLLGLSLPAIFSGALITEAVFNFPGMGELFWTAAQTQDYPIMLGITVLVGLATVIGSPARRPRLRRTRPKGEVRMNRRSGLVSGDGRYSGHRHSRPLNRGNGR